MIILLQWSSDFTLVHNLEWRTPKEAAFYTSYDRDTSSRSIRILLASPMLSEVSRWEIFPFSLIFCFFSINIRDGRTVGARWTWAPPLPTFFLKTVNKAYFFDVQECGAPPLFFNFCHPCIFILLVNFIRLSFESSLLIQLWNENKKQKIQVCSRKNYRH